MVGVMRQPWQRSGKQRVQVGLTQSFPRFAYLWPAAGGWAVPASCSDKSRLLAARCSLLAHCFLLLDLIEHVTVTETPPGPSIEFLGLRRIINCLYMYLTPRPHLPTGRTETLSLDSPPPPHVYACLRACRPSPGGAPRKFPWLSNHKSKSRASDQNLDVATLPGIKNVFVSEPPTLRPR